MADKAFFNKSEAISLAELARIGGCEVQNKQDENVIIEDVAPIDSAGALDITFLSNSKYKDSLQNSKARACILHEASIDYAPENMSLLISNDPYCSYAKIATYFYPNEVYESSISERASISKKAKIGKNVHIADFVVIEDNVMIADNVSIGASSYIGRGVSIESGSVINPQVTITHANIGKNVIIHSGVRIGQDGFGYAFDQGRHIKVPQIGRVIIEDEVEIGSNCCIDRGAGPDTVIGKGSKLDNLVQIGHNVNTGQGCIVVSQSGVSGSTKLGNYVVVGGQVGIAGHLTISDGVNIAAKSGVMKDIPPKEIQGGIPAMPIKQWHRQSVALKKLIDKKE